MCGIFGLILSPSSYVGPEKAAACLTHLFRLSESRGKEASGLALLAPESIRVIKHPMAASEFLRTEEYKTTIKHFLSENWAQDGCPESMARVALGHSRLVTNGTQEVHSNNQPVLAAGMVAIHNGIITNTEDLWLRNRDLVREYEVDTEVFLRLVRKYHDQSHDIIGALRRTYQDIEGVASVAILFEDKDYCLLATNNGSLYLYQDAARGFVVFASERYILSSLSAQRQIAGLIDRKAIHHIAPRTARLFDLRTLELATVPLDNPISKVSLPRQCDTAARKVLDITQRRPTEGRSTASPEVFVRSFTDRFPQHRDAVDMLRRCTRCILPATMPFILFDENGICNYCHHHHKLSYRGVDALLAAVEPYRSRAGELDCLITFSGGRDSSYGVHFLKTILDMHPVTYTYDWGMITDLGRRNQMRICGKLGIEHILVSADIASKRENIRKNVCAWLRRPTLGTVPLFMAGDKQYFYYANKVSQQTGCKIVVLCENPLETTRFKSGFCGVPPRHGTRQTYGLTFSDQMRMASYYTAQYLANPAYINTSLFNTFTAFLSYYAISKNYLNLYEYIPWDEETINSTIIAHYNWERATDTDSTWRIGDGTAAFYNYIYYTMAGFTENDTFRSNQIREGTLTRDQAMAITRKENEPRYESIRWYCETIHIDFCSTINAIDNAPKLYP